mmetsp:Transcript_61244/g.145787  ORF Transcript_61244/g.145787 Transcript_61244/m.145787 type:complete len:649 (+) Transcript_61244:108-2054(+)
MDSGLPLSKVVGVVACLLWSGCIAKCRAEATGKAPVEEPLARSFHNLFVIIVMLGLALWAAKVVVQLVRAVDLSNRVMSQQPLQLEGMSIYANDFQMLIRQHFNQILRIQRTVPPRRLPRHAMTIDLQPESLGLVNDDGPGAEARQGVSFKIDALAPCSVKLYWGVSIASCNEVLQRRPQTSGFLSDSVIASRRRRGRQAAPQSRFGLPSPLLEMEERQDSSSGASARVDDDLIDVSFQPNQCLAMSRNFTLPAGVGQTFTLQGSDLVDTSNFNFDVAAMWSRQGQQIEENALVPLIIVVIADRRSKSELGSVQGLPVAEAQGQITFVKFARGSGLRRFGQPEVFRQLSVGDRSTFDIQGVYGLEEDGESECVSCYSRPKNVLLLPCRHISVCHSCLRQLRDEKCPLCRAVFASYITFPVARPSVPVEGMASSRRGSEDPTSGSTPQPKAMPKASGPPSSAAPSPAAPGVAGGGSSGSTAPAPGTSPAQQQQGQAAFSSGMLRGVGNARTLAGIGQGSCEGAPPEASGPDAEQSGRGDCTSTGQAGASTQARETPTRARLWPRGVAPASRTTTQGLRFSGRARMSDRGDAEPLLQQDGAASTPTAAGQGRPRANTDSHPVACGPEDLDAAQEQTSLVAAQDHLPEGAV